MVPGNVPLRLKAQLRTLTQQRESVTVWGSSVLACTACACQFQLLDKA